MEEPGAISGNIRIGVKGRAHYTVSILSRFFVTLSLILPVKNERENLVSLLAEIASSIARFPEAEVIAVDDGSTDGTLEELKRLMPQYPMLRIIQLARNYGQTAAISAGMEAARGDVFLPMDSDGQNDPADIPRFLVKLEEGYDVVSGWRKARKDKWLRSLLSRVANRLIRRASGQEVHDYGCTMKAYRKETVKNLGMFGDMHRFLAAYTAMHGARIAEIEVHHRPRMHGKSKYGFGRIWRVILDLILLVFFLNSFTRPMHFFGGIGLLFNILGVMTIVAALLWRQLGDVSLIETPLPVLAALFIILGVQCLLMGVLAEMSMRTYFQAQNRKPYLVRATYSS